MAEENQDKNTSTTTDESKNTDKKADDNMIPKGRFDEVNNAKKELETKLAAIEAEKAEQEKKALEESGKFKELYEKEQAEKTRLNLEIKKRDLIQEAITNNKLHPRLSKMVQGSTEEEIKQSLEEAIAYHSEISDQFKQDKTADDNAGTGSNKKTAPMSTEEWMRLYEKDPKEADRILQEMTNAKQ